MILIIVGSIVLRRCQRKTVYDVADDLENIEVEGNLLRLVSAGGVDLAIGPEGDNL